MLTFRVFNYRIRLTPPHLRRYYMNNWYISLNYAYYDAQRTIEILKTLDYQKNRLLCGKNIIIYRKCPRMN